MKQRDRGVFMPRLAWNDVEARMAVLETIAWPPIIRIRRTASVAVAVPKS